MNERTLELYPPVDMRLLLRNRGGRDNFTFQLERGGTMFAKGSINIPDCTATINGEQIELATAPAGFGGQNVLFKCPHCGRRCWILYPTTGGCACRVCLGLVYRTQQASKTNWEAVYQQAEKVARRIDPDFHFTDYLRVLGSTWELFPPRPKNMRNSTYQRLLTRYRHYVEKGNEMQNAAYNALRSQIENSTRRRRRQ